ncbi:hypothetical protein [Paraburkholderia sp. MM6662-R1]|uniref:hypothetical protein n=1 Tax=Paraburkholderia sp. MM6662-R1 TaxID=2991066 RepID=UPI003D23C476
MSDMDGTFTLTPTEGRPLQQALHGVPSATSSQLLDRYRRYMCPTCETVHDSEWDAEDCCPRAIEMFYQCPVCDKQHNSVDAAADCERSHGDLDEEADGGPWACPVCHALFVTLQTAVDCCLWKRMGWEQRAQIVREVRVRLRSREPFEAHAEGVDQ